MSRPARPWENARCERFMRTLKEEQIDPSAEFRAHFEGDVPDFVGVGLMSDGDQTRSISAADYSGFVLVH